MTDRPPTTPADQEIASLRATVRMLEAERLHEVRRRRFHLAIVGCGVSLILHLCVLYFLAVNHRAGPPGDGTTPIEVSFEIAVEEPLTELESTDLDDLLAEESAAESMLEDEPIEALDPAIPSADLEVRSDGALPTLGGASGSGAGGGSGGINAGGAGTSFFGVSSTGERFAYIVDRSGSMQNSRKLTVAMRELARSVTSLPDYAQFLVVLFSSDIARPPMQNGWLLATHRTTSSFVQWLESVEAVGGTQPLPAFQAVLAMDPRPDVIFFLTDGEIPVGTDELVAALNARGESVVINTIAFGNPSSQDQLKQIANRSGGAYRFVPTSRNQP